MENNVYDEYVTTHFKSRHNMDDLKKEYNKVFLLWKYNYSRYLPSDKKSKILEIGCGLGHHLYAIEKLGYQNIFGIDISRECIDVCQKNGFNAILEDSLNYLARTKEKFSIIFLFNVFEHFKKEDGLKLLKLINARLIHGGVCIIKTENAGNPFNLHLRYTDITHEIMYTEDSISQILKLGNFSKVNVFPAFNFAINDITFLGKIKRKLGVLSCNIMWRGFTCIYISQGIRSPKILSDNLLAIGVKDE